MPSLAETQTTLIDAIVHSRNDALLNLIAHSPISLERALRVHKSTVFGGLANALRLAFPTVDWLVGESFFDQAAAEYARMSPPAEADFGHFFEGFANFLADYSLAQSVPYLADVARFDRALDRAGQSKLDWAESAFDLDASTRLDLSASLSVLDTSYPVDDIRSAYETRDGDALSHIEIASVRWLAVWRTQDRVTSRRLSASSGMLLHRLLSGCDLATALAAALAEARPESALQSIQAEIFAAPFARITTERIQGVGHAHTN